MNCEECKKRPATVHLTKIVNGDRVESRLCEQCAREKEELGSIFTSGFSLQQLLSGLLQGDTPPGPRSAGPTQSVRCECGMTYVDFAKSGRLGCHRCYTAFSDRLVPILRRIHGNVRHLGKVPVRTGGLAKVRREMDDLRESLRRLVTEENYEDAARVRDRIRELGRELGDSF